MELGHRYFKAGVALVDARIKQRSQCLGNATDSTDLATRDLGAGVSKRVNSISEL